MKKLIFSIPLILASLSAGASYLKLPNDLWTGAEGFPDEGFHFNVHKLFGPHVQSDSRLDKLSPLWPLEDKTPALLTRFGTPTTLVDAYMKFSYTHEALDITRSANSISDIVRAPVSGKAIVVYDAPSEHDYSTAVAILDEESQLVVSLLHVSPSAHLTDRQFIHVKKGDIIGTLAPVESMSDPLKQELYKHTHLALVDIKDKKLRSPNTVFSHYQDKVPPTVLGMTVFDSAGNKIEKLKSDKLDIALKVIDRDGINARNFEISSFSLEVKDQNNLTLLNIEACTLEGLTEALSAISTTDAFHLDHIANFWNEDFEFQTNASVENREFSYALTNFKSVKGKCVLQKDAESDIQINDGVQSLNIEVTVGDHHQNKASAKFRLDR